MTATLSLAHLVVTPRPHTGRFGSALRALGRGVVRGLATDNGWFWAFGVWYPYLDMAARSHGPDR